MSNSIHYPQKIRKTGKKLIIGSFLAKFLPLKSQMLFFIIFVFRVWTDLNIPKCSKFNALSNDVYKSCPTPPIIPEKSEKLAKN